MTVNSGPKLRFILAPTSLVLGSRSSFLIFPASMSFFRDASETPDDGIFPPKPMPAVSLGMTLNFIVPDMSRESPMRTPSCGMAA